MSYRIKKVVVLGSGVMGSGIACHLANVGMDVLMLDIIPSEYSKSKDKKIRNSIADSALMKAIKSKPSPLYEKKNAEKIITGNFTDNFKDISYSDLNITKPSLFPSLKEIRNDKFLTETIVTHNNSVLEIIKKEISVT